MSSSESEAAFTDDDEEYIDDEDDEDEDDYEDGDLFGSDFMGLLTPVKVVAYGFPTDELSQALTALSPVKMSSFQGFCR